MEEGFVGSDQVLVSDEESAELSEPSVGAFYDPASFVSSELCAVFIASLAANLRSQSR